MKIMIHKIKNQSGFTLAETLMTVLIVLLASSVIAAGIPAASNAYMKAVDAANAQVLLSTTVNALRSELSTAWGVETHDGNVEYYSSKTGAKTRLSLGDDNIMVLDYVQYGGTTGQTDPNTHTVIPAYELVSKKARDEKFKVSYSSPSVANGMVKFENVTVKDKAGKEIASSGELSIRLLREDFTIPEIIIS